MGFLDLFKKKQKVEQPSDALSIHIEWDDLDATNEIDKDDADLPFGWVAHNKEFIEPIEKEFSYFMNNWIDARNKSPKAQKHQIHDILIFL